MGLIILHPLAKKHFENLFKKYESLGPNKNCKYYPCHSDLEDCTFCYCIFYSCEDALLGKYVKNKKGEELWSCKDCSWIHKEDIAKKVLYELRKLNLNAEDIKKENLIKIKENLFKN